MKTRSVSKRHFFNKGIFFLIVFLQSLSGLALAVEPTTPSSTMVVALNNCNEFDLSWTSGDGNRRLVVGSADGPVSSFPVDGMSYVAGTIFGSGTNLGNNNYVIYSANGSSVTVTALNANKTYYFAVFEYNGTGGGTDYLTSVYPEVDSIPFGVSITITASDTVLCSGSSVTLDASGANTYVWSPGSGLNTTFGPSVIASPSATTRYSVLGTDGSGCQAYERITLTVNPRPTVTLSAQPSSCIDDDPRVLSGGSPSGGVYSGPGVSNGEFDPGAAGTGFHTITYTYTNAQGCSNSATRTITVYSLPNVNQSSFSSRCYNAGAVTLSGGTPGGGSYSGPGVSSGVFDPVVAGVGTHTITYQYTDSHGCSSSASSTLTVNPSPSVTLSNFSVICVNAAPINLSGGSPSGGTYSGDGVSAGIFNPSDAGVGTHTITYLVTNAQGCSDSASKSIQVAGQPSVTVSPLNGVCKSASPFTLSGGNPTGGVFSGDGISNNIFSPAVADTGVHTVTYTYTNLNGCSNSATTSIEVYPAPEVSLGTFNDVCANTGPVTLNTGTPAGGVYSGVAVSGTTFFTGIAGPGTHAIIYTITDSVACSASDTQYIEVRPIPVVHLGADTTICMNESIHLDAGAGFSSYFWNTGANTQSINVDTTGRGTGSFSFRVSVTNSYGCVGKDTILVTLDICTGLDAVNGLKNKISMYPNPFKETFHITLAEKSDVFIFDQAGRLVLSYENIQGEISAGEMLSPGVYIATFRSKGSDASLLLLKE